MQEKKVIEYIVILFTESILKVLTAALGDDFLYWYFCKCNQQFFYIFQRVKQTVQVAELTERVEALRHGMTATA